MAGQVGVVQFAAQVMPGSRLLQERADALENIVPHRAILPGNISARKLTEAYCGATTSSGVA
jgi:hypothetical protein